MSDNPYSSPSASSVPESSEATIQFREFSANLLSFQLSPKAWRNETRRKAQLAIHAEIGVENVVSIAESFNGLTGFTVAVWYRER